MRLDQTRSLEWAVRLDAVNKECLKARISKHKPALPWHDFAIEFFHLCLTAKWWFTKLKVWQIPKCAIRSCSLQFKSRYQILKWIVAHIIHWLHANCRVFCWHLTKCYFIWIGNYHVTAWREYDAVSMHGDVLENAFSCLKRKRYVACSILFLWYLFLMLPSTNLSQETQYFRLTNCK